MNNFLNINDLSKDKIFQFIDGALNSKNSLLDQGNELSGKNLIVFFEKKSTRTRLSFDIAIKQLGGSSTILNKEDIHLANQKENIGDTIKTFSLYADGLILRVDDHNTLSEAAKYSDVPIINALSNISHPCQCMAGLMTLIEEKKSLNNLNILWIGPITNVANSWIDAFNMDLGFSFNIFCPEKLSEKYINKMKDYKINPKIDCSGILHGEINKQLLENADVIMTDTWHSMGDDTNIDDLKTLKEFRVTNKIMSYAKSDCIFMHCLPANRNEEVDGEVIDGRNSRVWQEAKNRLFIQKQILKELI